MCIKVSFKMSQSLDSRYEYVVAIFESSTRILASEMNPFILFRKNRITLIIIFFLFCIFIYDIHREKKFVE